MDSHTPFWHFGQVFRPHYRSWQLVSRVLERACCLLVLNSVTSTLQWTCQQKQRDFLADVTASRLDLQASVIWSTKLKELRDGLMHYFISQLHVDRLWDGGHLRAVSLGHVLQRRQCGSRDNCLRQQREDQCYKTDERRSEKSKPLACAMTVGAAAMRSVTFVRFFQSNYFVFFRLIPSWCFLAFWSSCKVLIFWTIHLCSFLFLKEQLKDIIIINTFIFFCFSLFVQTV